MNVNGNANKIHCLFFTLSDVCGGFFVRFCKQQREREVEAQGATSKMDLGKVGTY